MYIYGYNLDFGAKPIIVSIIAIFPTSPILIAIIKPTKTHNNMTNNCNKKTTHIFQLLGPYPWLGVTVSAQLRFGVSRLSFNRFAFLPGSIRSLSRQSCMIPPDSNLKSAAVIDQPSCTVLGQIITKSPRSSFFLASIHRP
jgi:hypothetical protein